MKESPAQFTTVIEHTDSIPLLCDLGSEQDVVWGAQIFTSPDREVVDRNGPPLSGMEVTTWNVNV